MILSISLWCQTYIEKAAKLWYTFAKCYLCLCGMFNGPLIAWAILFFWVHLLRSILEHKHFMHPLEMTCLGIQITMEADKLSVLARIVYSNIFLFFKTYFVFMLSKSGFHDKLLITWLLFHYFIWQWDQISLIKPSLGNFT